MDFIKSALGAMGDDGESLEQAWRSGEALANGKLRDLILKEALPFAIDGEHMEASVVTFTAAWTLIQWLETGVRHSDKLGPDNPVRKVWELVEAAKRGATPEEAVAAMNKVKRGWEK